MSSKPTPETGAAILDPVVHKIRGRTLRAALAGARREFGEDACIIETRSVTRGDERFIEVSVCPAPGETPIASTPPQPRPDPARTAEAIRAEVERIETMVETLVKREAAERAERETGFDDYPLAKRLLATGASLPAVRLLRRLYLAETGGRRPHTAERHLRDQLRTSGGDWASLAGCHLFLGGPGAGKTDLVLATAARLKDLGHRALVLTYAPRHAGEIERFREEATAHGYDAAILKDAAHLAAGLEIFAAYDVVLIDTPAHTGDVMSDPDLRDMLAGLENVHRHLVLPLDIDTPARERAWSEARGWNCDWLSLTRLDRTAGPGKLVDVLLSAPMAVSLVAGGEWPGSHPVIPDAADLVERILGVDAVRAAESR